MDQKKIELMTELTQLYQSRSFMQNTPEVQKVIDEYIEELEHKLRKMLKHGETERKMRRKNCRYLDYKKDKRRKEIIEYRNVYRRKYFPMVGWLDSENGYVKLPKNSANQKFSKRACNKAVRRYKGYIPNGNAYRRVRDYWNEVY